MMRSTSVAVGAVLVGLLVAAASGASATSADATPTVAAAETSARTFKTTLYFLTPDESAPLGVRRSLRRTSPFALAAMRGLLAGPTRAERARGLRTAIPAGTTLLSLRIVRNSTAIVNLSGLPANGTAVDRARVITQVTRSLVGLSGIEAVRLRSDGKPWGLWRMNGEVADISYRYGQLLGFTGLGGGGGSFSALP